MFSESIGNPKDNEKLKQLQLDLSVIEKNDMKKRKSVTKNQLGDCLSEMDTQRTEDNEILGNIDYECKPEERKKLK